MAHIHIECVCADDNVASKCANIDQLFIYMSAFKTRFKIGFNENNVTVIPIVRVQFNFVWSISHSMIFLRNIKAVCILNDQFLTMRLHSKTYLR